MNLKVLFTKPKGYRIAVPKRDNYSRQILEDAQNMERDYYNVNVKR